MKTDIIKISPNEICEKKAVFNKAANILKSGGLVAFPTETVYGLGANGLNPNSVKKIYAAKGRPSDNPLILHISEISELNRLVKEIPKKAELLIKKFWPGPLSLVFKKSTLVPFETSGGLDTIAIRMPDNEIALKLIKESGVPICAPSANISGSPSPTLANHVFLDLEGKIELILDGGPCNYGLESTILDVTSNEVCMLRPGNITKSEIEQVIGEIKLDISLFNRSENNQLKAKAPGMKYKHYAPKASIQILKGDETKINATINTLLAEDLKNNIRSGVIITGDSSHLYNTNNKIIISNNKDQNAIAKNLFNSLRICDEKNLQKVYIPSFEENDLGFSIMNRLKKASGYNIFKV